MQRHNAAAGRFADSCANCDAQLHCTVHTATEQAVCLLHKSAHLVYLLALLYYSRVIHTLCYTILYTYMISVSAQELSFAFKRAASRLVEMGSAQYMSDWRKRRYAASAIQAVDSSAASLTQRTPSRSAVQ
jgi:predicted ATPase